MAFGVVKAVGGGIAAAVVGIVAAIIGILAIFFFATIGAVMGAITGWIVHVVPVLGPLVENGFRAVGIASPDLVAIGAMLGFVAGFFKSSGNSGKCG